MTHGSLSEPRRARFKIEQRFGWFAVNNLIKFFEKFRRSPDKSIYLVGTTKNSDSR